MARRRSRVIHCDLVSAGYGRVELHHQAANDTSDAISKIVLERYRSMTAAERWLATSSLFETARAIIQSSLPSSLTTEQRRLAIVQRLYKGELPEEALIAHANYIAAEGNLRIRRQRP